MKLIMENWKRYLVEAEKAESDPTLKEMFIDASRLVVINKEGVLGKQRLTTFYVVSSASSKKITFPNGETRDAFARKLTPKGGGWKKPYRDEVIEALRKFLRKSNRAQCRREGCTWLAEMFTGAWMNNYVATSPPEPDGSFYLFLHEPETQSSQSGQSQKTPVPNKKKPAPRSSSPPAISPRRRKVKRTKPKPAAAAAAGVKTYWDKINK